MLETFIDAVHAHPVRATAVLTGLAILEWAWLAWAIYQTSWLAAARREKRAYRRQLQTRLQAIADRHADYEPL